MDNVFHKILRGEIPAKIEYEDDECFVIKDIAPKAPVHLLVIPKKELESIGQMTSEDTSLIGNLTLVATQMAKKFGIGDAFKIVINSGEGAGQSVMQLHIHVLGGWKHKPKEEI
jgi:histidine triad (HIT) family protein